MSYNSASFKEMLRQKSEETEELRLQLNQPRTLLSRSLRELISYTEQNIHDDPLIHPIKDNPFKDKKTCTII